MWCSDECQFSGGKFECVDFVNSLSAAWFGLTSVDTDFIQRYLHGSL